MDMTPMQEVIEWMRSEHPDSDCATFQQFNDARILKELEKEYMKALNAVHATEQPGNPLGQPLDVSGLNNISRALAETMWDDNYAMQMAGAAWQVPFDKMFYTEVAYFCNELYGEGEFDVPYKPEYADFLRRVALILVVRHLDEIPNLDGSDWFFSMYSADRAAHELIENDAKQDHATRAKAKRFRLWDSAKAIMTDWLLLRVNFKSFIWAKLAIEKFVFLQLQELTHENIQAMITRVFSE